MKINFLQNKMFFAFILLLLGMSAFAEDSAWVSPNTVAATVKLYTFGTSYIVEGLAEDYEYSEDNNGEPNFGNANVVQAAGYTCTGTGVIVTKNGLIVSNAHVTEAAHVTINPYVDEEGNEQEGVMEVNVPAVFGSLFVGIVDKSQLESKGNDKITFKYLAEVLYEDKDFNDEIRDRAVLLINQTVDYTDESNWGNIQDKLQTNLPYVTMANPFVRGYLETKVRAIGFPTTGDPLRSAKTSGEIMGYDSDAGRSVIKHTSYISGGNSGGGLFFKDALVGINTWDYLENESRPVAMAQPITYYFECLSRVAWLYPNIEVPNVDYKWLEDDPSDESYKTEAVINIQVNNKSKNNVGVIVYSKKLSADSIHTYLESEEYFQNMIAVSESDLSPKEIAAQLGWKVNFIKSLQQCQDIDEIGALVPKNMKADWNMFVSGEFTYKIYDMIEIADPNRYTINVPKNAKYNIAVINADGEVGSPSEISVGASYTQGPVTIK